MILDEKSGFANDIDTICYNDRKIQKFCVTSNGLLVVFVEDTGKIQLVSIPDQCIVPSLFYQLPEGEHTVLGMELDFQNKLWVSTVSHLYVINEDFKLVRSYEVEKSRTLNAISSPDQFTSNLCLSFDRMKVLWYKSNYELIQIHTKTLEILTTTKGVVKTGKFSYILRFLKLTDFSGY